MASAVGQLEKVRALAISGRFLAVGGIRADRASEITLYDYIEEKPARSIDVPAHVLGLAADSDHVVAACSDGKLRVFDAAKGELVHEIAASESSLNAVAISGDLVASAGADGTLRTFSKKTGKKHKEWVLSSRPLRAVAIEPANEGFAAAGDDGVVRVVWTRDDSRREMSGHDGPVLSLAFTPADGRLVSGGEDGTLRIWFLVGDVEADVRGTDDSGHVGGTTSLVFLPGKDATETGARIASSGADGKIRIWRTGERRKPRTFETKSDPLFATAFAPIGKQNVLGKLFLGGDLRTLFAISFDNEANPAESLASFEHGFNVLEADLAASAQTKRESAVKTLSALGEIEALDLLLGALEKDREPEIRALIATELASHARSGARKALRLRLDDEHASVRSAALAALRKLEATSPLSPLRAALGSKFADMRSASLAALVPLFTTSPLVAGLIAGRLADPDANVRRVALRSLVALYPKNPIEALRTGFERGAADVRAEALLRGAVQKLDRELAPLVGQALDDEDADVRRTAFVVSALSGKNLIGWLESKDEAFVRALAAALARIARLDDAATTEPSAEELARAKTLFLGGKAGVAATDLSEDDRTPLLAALACKTPDTSLRGARGLALLGDMRALGALLTISREPDAALRRDAAIALTFLEDPRAKKRLAWMLNDADASVRDAALGCYAKLESDALSIAEVALQSSQEDIRVRGLDILIKQGKQNPRAEELLGDSLEDEASKVRAEAFRTLWAWHESDPLGPLDRALTARFPDLRQRAVEELDNLATKKDGPLAAPALERLQKTIADRDVGVARSAYEKTLELRGKADADTHLLAMASTQAVIRQRGAADAHKAPVERVRSELSKLLEDKDASVRTAAIESLDKLTTDAAPLRIGLQSSYLDLRVRAAELLSIRRDESPIDPMQALLADLDLVKRLGPDIAVPLRRRAATSLANIGTPRLLRYFATDLVKDDDPIVREQGARGLSNATRRGEEGHLLDLLGHEEVALRSWAAEGLARLGDTRALPVLTGTLRHEHPPIRVGAILSFAALGPEGYGGMLQGLEDPSRDVQRIVLSVILARDLRAFRAGESPDLLTSALSSQRPEVRFAAARALELRINPEEYLAHLGEVLLPDRPEKASDMEKWPSEEQRAHLMVALAEALAGERPEQRYAAAQALRLRDRPLDYFREVSRATRPTSTTAPWVPETSPNVPPPTSDPPKKGPLGFLRRLFSQGTSGQPDARASESAVPAADQQRLRLLAFGAYVGLLRQALEDDEANRVRRDSIERIAELTNGGHVSVTSAMPALARALDDPNHLVRKNAFAALRKIYPSDPETPLALALACSAADVVRAALDELATRGEAGKPRIVKALDSDVAEARKYAFELLEKLSEKGSLEPLLAALGSEHADIRIGVLERLSTSQDPRVSAALGKALESDHEDLRLRAAELLAGRRDDRAADALGQALRSDDAGTAQRARAALSRLGSATAVRTLAARFDDEIEEAERALLVTALGNSRAKEAVDALALRLDDESATVRSTAFSAAARIAGPRTDAPRQQGKPKEKPRDSAIAQRFLVPAARSKYADIRLEAARELDDLDDSSADATLVSLFGDRDVAVRTSAVASYATRVEKKNAPPAPLEDLVRAGARETMLSAAEGLAHRRLASAFRPLLLFVRAGEEGERERALLGLGTLGDQRALAELEVIAGGGTEEAPADVPMQAAALEALGRLYDKLKDSEEKERVRDRIEGSIGTKENPVAVAAVKALRWIGGERARARIESVLSASTSTPAEREASVKALGELGDVAAEAALGKALDEYGVRWEARYALEKLFPNERTRIELHAVESSYDDLSGPAATFLASEGDPSLLLEKLAKLEDDSLRERLRFGLMRRKEVPGSALEKLLGSPSAQARADAAWVIGVRADLLGADAKTLSTALLGALEKTEAAHRDAVRLGKEEDEVEPIARAWLMAMWAARRLKVEAAASMARRLIGNRAAPSDVRVEAARMFLGDASARPELEKALGDPDLVLRFEAASALASADPLALPVIPDDPVLQARSVGAAPGARALEKSLGRRVFVPSLARRHNVEGLVDVARRGKGQDQLDAIGALGLIPSSNVIEALGELAAKNGSDDEKVRRAAFRALRQAQRRAERQAKEAAE